MQIARGGYHFTPARRQPTLCFGGRAGLHAALQAGAAVLRAGGEVARSFLVGDTETDVKTARAAGVKVALVGFGPEGPGIDRLGPDYLLHDFAGLPDLARRWLGANAPTRRKA